MSLPQRPKSILEALAARREAAAAEAKDQTKFALPEKYSSVKVEAVIPPRPTKAPTSTKTQLPGLSRYIVDDVNGIDLTVDDVMFLFIMQESGFTIIRFLAEASGRSVEATRKRIVKLKAAGLVEAVKGPYIVILYRITQIGIDALEASKMPLRNFDPFGNTANYTQSCTLAGLIAQAAGQAGANDLFLSDNAVDGKLAVLSNIRMTQAVDDVQKKQALGTSQLFKDQKAIQNDMSYPCTGASQLTYDAISPLTEEVLDYWHGMIKGTRSEPLKPRSYVFTTLDRYGIWTPDFVIPLPRAKGQAISSIAALVYTRFENDREVKRDLENLSKTFSVNFFQIYCGSASIASETQRCLLELERDQVLPYGIHTLFDFKMLEPRNYTGKNSDAGLTQAGITRARTGFHG